MKKFNRSQRCLLTNIRKPKPHHVVISGNGNHLVATRNGRSIPWPLDLKLIVKGRGTFFLMMKHMKKRSEEQVEQG